MNGRWCTTHDAPEETGGLGYCMAWANSDDIPATPACSFTERADAQIRAQALQAAASWLPWRDGQTMTDAEGDLLARAERFAAWIESGERSA